MSVSPVTADDFLTISPRIRVMPIIHGSGDFAIQVREELLSRPYDCVAVPLPPSFQEDVEAAIEQLAGDFGRRAGRCRDRRLDDCRARTRLQLRADRPLPGSDRRLAHGAGRADRARVHRPRDAAVRAGHRRLSRSLCAQAGQTRAFRGGHPGGRPAPDARPEHRAHRLDGARLRELETRYRSILFVCSILDWPWIRDAYQRRLPPPEPESFFSPIVDLPRRSQDLDFRTRRAARIITGLYERGRRELTPDDNLSVDGVKEMVLDARERLREKHPKIAQRITPQLLVGLFSVRPQPVAARPAADARPVHARRGGPADGRRRLRPGAGRDGANLPVRRCRTTSATESSGFDEPGLARMGINQAELPVWGTGPMVSRLPGQALSWRTCELRPRPRAGRADPLAAALEPVRHVLLAAGGRPDRELPSPRPRPGQGHPGRRPGAHREVHDQRSRRHRHPRDAAELAYGRPVRQGRAAEPRLDRGRGLPVRRPRRPRASTSIAPPGTPSTPRNRRWPSTPPIP